jgi:hypothetical protein
VSSKQNFCRAVDAEDVGARTGVDRIQCLGDRSEGELVWDVLGQDPQDIASKQEGPDAEDDKRREEYASRCDC